MPARTGRRLAALGVSAAVALMVTPALPAAHSQVRLSCAGSTPQERFERSPVVFSGSVISKRVKRVAHYSPDRTGVSYSRTTMYRIKPTHVYKGYVRSPQRVSSANFQMSGEGPFLFFASRPTTEQATSFKQRGARPPVYIGACSGTRKLKPGEKPPFVAGPPASPVP